MSRLPIALAAAALFAAGSPACAAGGKKDGPGILGKGVAVLKPGVAEPSGIAFDAALGHLFVVGDEGSLAELDAQGNFVRMTAVAGNLEDVTVHPPSGNLVLVDEAGSRLIVFDPRTRQVVSRWKLDADALVGKREASRNGFEGIVFRAEAGRAGGGIFYLVHQSGPAMVVAIAFDPTQPGGTIGSDAVLQRWGLPGQRDLTAAIWSPSLQRLLVLSDAEDALLVVNAKGAVEERIHVPGLQQEGACFDAAGDLWIADDRGASVKRYAGALQAIASAVRIDYGPPGKAKGKKD